MLQDPQKRDEIDVQDPDGNTLLMDASREGNYDLVYLLLSHLANPLVENHAGETALVVAERVRRARERVVAIEILLFVLS